MTDGEHERLTDGQRQRLQSDLEATQRLLALHRERLGNLEREQLIEAGVAQQFQLEHLIQEERATIDALTGRIMALVDRLRE